MVGLTDLESIVYKKKKKQKETETETKTEKAHKYLLDYFICG